MNLSCMVSPWEDTNYVRTVPLVSLQSGEHKQQRQSCEIPRNPSQQLHVTFLYLAIIMQHRNSISFSCFHSYPALLVTQSS